MGKPKGLGMAIALFSVLVAAALALAACGNAGGGEYKIEVVSGEDLVVDCPKSADAGEQVTIETTSVTDAVLYVNVSDVEGEWERDGFYTFTMPDHDVEVSAHVSTAGFTGA